MNVPDQHSIQVAYDHAVWLRSAGPLGPRDRMICDLGYEVQQLRAAITDVHENRPLSESEQDAITNKLDSKSHDPL